MAVRGQVGGAPGSFDPRVDVELVDVDQLGAGAGVAVLRATEHDRQGLPTEAVVQLWHPGESVRDIELPAVDPEAGVPLQISASGSYVLIASLSIGLGQEARAPATLVDIRTGQTHILDVVGDWRLVPAQ